MWWMLLGACHEDVEESVPVDDAEPAPLITVLSPTASGEYHYPDAVPLRVQATRDGELVEILRATWTVDGRAVVGDDTEVQGLTPGEYPVSLIVVVETRTLDAAVSFTVLPEVDTDSGSDSDSDTQTDTDPDTDTGPVDWTYNGTISAQITYDGSYGHYEDDCPGRVHFGITGNQLTGTGACTAFDTEFPFTLVGRFAAGAWTGDLVMTFDGEDALTPFTASGAAGDTIDALFDTSHAYDGDTVRINGSWTASPG